MRVSAIEEEEIRLLEEEKRREREVGKRHKDVVTSNDPAAMPPSIYIQLLEGLNISQSYYQVIAFALTHLKERNTEQKMSLCTESRLNELTSERYTQ